MSTLLHLPPELLLSLPAYLLYPDTLALSHAHPYLYALLHPSLTSAPGIRLKVAWLVDRKSRGLSCLEDVGCNLKSDAEFCSSRGGAVRKIMERRRRHKECGIWCEVLVGRRCVGKVGEGGRGNKKSTCEGIFAGGAVEVGFALGMVGLAKWFDIGNVDWMIGLVVAMVWVTELTGMGSKFKPAEVMARFTYHG